MPRMKAEYVIGGIIILALGSGFVLYERSASGAPPAPQAASATSSRTATLPSTFLTPTEKAARYQKAPELVSPDGYINTAGQPITIGQFKGKKVVLIDIWTYSYINCQRTLPYLKTWYDTYSDQGLEIIGVHTPEFAFEHTYQNVADAVARFGLKYPVVLDNEYMTWNAFGNQFWPRKYLVDIDGYIVYDHAGEGNYDETEQAIQAALAERSARLGVAMPTSTPAVAPQGVVTIDAGKLGSPETYFGAMRNEYLGNGEQGKTGLQTLTVPSVPALNTLYLGGAWNLEQEFAENQTANAQITYMYSAKNVYFVASADKPVKIKVTRDGRPLGSERGADVDENGEATIQEDRLYELVRGADYGTHVLEITVKTPGLKAYTFTFG